MTRITADRIFSQALVVLTNGDGGPAVANCGGRATRGITSVKFARAAEMVRRRGPKCSAHQGRHGSCSPFVTRAARSPRRTVSAPESESLQVDSSHGCAFGLVMPERVNDSRVPSIGRRHWPFASVSVYDIRV